MRYLIISDIHGNLHALESVLRDAAAIGYDAVVCLGDLVGYGADPSAVIQRVRELAPVKIVRGNHDKVAAGLEPAVLFNEVARRSIEWTRQTVSEDELAYLAALPKGPARRQRNLRDLPRLAVRRRSLRVRSGRRRALHRGVVRARVPVRPHPFARGVHRRRRSSDDRQRTRRGRNAAARQRPGARSTSARSASRATAIRAPRTASMDLDKGTIRLRRTVYDVQGAQKKIMKAGLPQWLALRLEKGQ